MSTPHGPGHFPPSPASGPPSAAHPPAPPTGYPPVVAPSAPPAPSVPPSGQSPRRGRGIASLRLRGLWLVTSLELRQRLRSKRWYVALGVWTVVMLGIGGLGLAPTLYTSQWDAIREVAAVIFSLQAILVLFAMLLVVPALSAGSINGDRTAGTLATLQSSLLSPTEIVLGKLLAGFLTGVAFLVLALPSLLPVAVLGQVGILYFLRVLLVILLLTLCVTAVGLGLSSLTTRQLGSVVLAYVIVFGLTIVMPITWGVSALFVTQEREMTVYSTTWTDAGEPDVCEAEVRDVEVPRVDLTLPLMWGNPVVLLAEAAPVLTQDFWANDQDVDVLSLIKAGIKVTATTTHPAHWVYCDPADEGYPDHIAEVPNRPVWPMGLGLWLLGGGLSVLVAIRRLAVPIRRLGPGTRIA